MFQSKMGFHLRQTYVLISYRNLQFQCTSCKCCDYGHGSLRLNVASINNMFWVFRSDKICTCFTVSICLQRGSYLDVNVCDKPDFHLFYHKSRYSTSRPNGLYLAMLLGERVTFWYLSLDRNSLKMSVCPHV